MALIVLCAIEQVSFQRLKVNLYEYVKIRERVCRQFWQSKQPWNAKKQLLHVLRVMEVSLQLVNHGRVVDYTTANHFYLEAQQLEHLDTHDKFKAWWNSHYQPLYTTLKHQLNIYKDRFAQLPATLINQLPILDYLQFAAHNDFEQLERELCITSTIIDYPRTEEASLGSDPALPVQNREQAPAASPLVLLERTFYSPRHPSIQQCYRLIVRRVGDQPDSPNWEIIAMAPRKYWEHGADKYVTDPSEKFAETLDLNTAIVYKKPVGIGVLVFWHEESLNAVFCSSGFYASSYASRHNLPNQQLGHALHSQFWTAFRKLGCQNPPKSKNWTFQFVFHPDENILQLQSIMDVSTLQDISMVSATDMGLEDKDTPFFESFAQSLGWPCLERVRVKIPNKQPKTEEHMKANLEAIHQAAQLQDIVRFEGFLLADSKGVRLQSSLSQFAALEKLTSMYERRYRTNHFLAIVRATCDKVPTRDSAEKNASGLTGEERFCRDYPQWAAWYRYISLVFGSICEQMDAIYQSKLAQIENVDDFKAACDAFSPARAKALWKLRTSKKTAMDLFTTYKDLEDRTAASICLMKWVNELRVFDDVTPSERENQLF